MNSIGSRPLKRLTNQSKEIVLNIHKFMKNEAQEAKNCVFTKQTYFRVYDRTAQATKASKVTISRILNERDRAVAAEKQSGPTFRTPKTGRLKRQYRLKLDDFAYQAIRRKLYEFRLTDKRAPTIQLLYNKMKKDIAFSGSLRTLRKIQIDLGFVFRKYASNRKPLLLEKNEIRLRRIKYLKQIKKYRSEGRDIVYGDVAYLYSNSMQTKEGAWCDRLSKGIQQIIAKVPRLVIVHAGSAKGFMPNSLLIMGDCHSEVTKQIYEKWLREQLIPNLQPNSIFVIDETSYHSTIEERVPNSNSTKKTMQNWLASKNIDFDTESYKPELYEIIKRLKDQYTTYSLDTILEAHGHKVLRLPAYHPDFNPVDYIWSEIKGDVENVWSKVNGYINKYNVALSVSEVQEFTEIFESIEPDKWRRAADQAIRCEDEFLMLEDAMDARIDQVIAETENDWIDDDSLSSDSSCDSNTDSDGEPFASVFIKSK